MNEGCGKDITREIRGTIGVNGLFNGCIRLVHLRCGEKGQFCNVRANANTNDRKGVKDGK